MAIIGWIISTMAFLGGLALRQDMPFFHNDQIANGLLAAAFLSFPPFWRDRPFGIGAKPRIVLCLAMLLSLPTILIQP
jgi:hypothetical protein